MRIDSHTELSDELLEAWERLHRADPLASPFTSPGWVRASWKHFGQGSRPWVLTVVDANAVIGLAPLAVRREAGVRVAGPAAESLSDYWDVIALPRLRDQVLEAVSLCLRRRGGLDWDELKLTRLPSDSSTGRALATSGVVRMRQAGYPCPSVELPASWEDYLASLPARRRSNLVRHMRRLDDGTVKIRQIEEPSDIPAAVRRWHELRMAQWRDQDRVLHSLQSTDRFANFITDALLELVPQGIAMLWEITSDDRLAGSYVNFADDDTYYWYLGGYDTQQSGLGVGKIAIGEGIRRSIAAGRKRYDFMIGDEPYKRWYGASPRRGVELLTVRSRSPRSTAAFLIRRGRVTLRRGWPRIRRPVPARGYPRGQ